MTAHPGPGGLSAQKKVSIRGSERHVRPSYEATGPAPPDKVIRVVIKLRPRQPLPDPAVLGNVLPTNRPAPTYGDHVAQYGASAEDVQAVVDFAKAHHLTVVESSAPMRMVILSGTVKDMEAAFETQLQTFHSAKHGDSYRGRTGSITIPEALQPIITVVSGLDDRPQAKARTTAHKAKKKPKTTFYTPPQLAQLYDYPTSLDGTGQCIGLFEFGGGYQQSDLDAFFQKIGVPTPSVTSVSVDGTTNSPGSDADGEVVLDIQVAGGAAPGAKIAVYFAQFTEAGWVEAITKAVHDTVNKPSVISISWGWSELEDAGTLAWTSAVMNEVNTTLAEAANLQITVLVAAGDDGSSDGITDGKVHVDFPSSSLNVLAVGGTTLLSSNGEITSEVVWSGGTRETGTGSTGGGVSEVFPKPSWQSGANLKVPPSASTKFVGRGVPDVCANADANTGYLTILNGQSGIAGGTSAATPLWAALIARINQRLATLPGSKSVGYINPLLYQQIGATSAFHDITSGNNDTASSVKGAYTAGPGWDACSGWGSPDGANLLAALTGGAEPVEAGGGAAVIGMSIPAKGTNGHSATTNPLHANELEAERQSNRLLIETVHRLTRFLGSHPA